MICDGRCTKGITRNTMGNLLSDEPEEVIPGLYIGHLGSATNARVREQLKISHVVNVSGLSYPYPITQQCLTLPVPDVPYFDIRSIFAETNAFIHRALSSSSNNRVLIHCQCGISRSATVLIAYLMAHWKMSLMESFSLVKWCRPCVQPNWGFRHFLRLYERNLAESSQQ